MILITGAAGFIGSAMIWKLNRRGIDGIIGVDKFHSGNKWKNLRKQQFYDWVDRDSLFDWLHENGHIVSSVIHLGACTDTTEMDVDYFIHNNFEYSMRLWQFFAGKNIPFLYASSAATYGGGEFGYTDDESIISNLQPLNPYGWSKQIFDRWVLKQDTKPKKWYGFKFFNVYGPNEYHKKHMASVIYHAFNQAKQDGTIRLFKSHRENIRHGEQKRDFIYVKDVIDIIGYFVDSNAASGIYNIGTGKARSFNALASSVCKACDQKISIEYIDMPKSLRKQYQYFTEANIDKLNKAGYTGKIHDLESGVKDYVQSYLATDDPYL